MKKFMLLKKHVLLLVSVLLINTYSFGQGFSTAPINWTLPSDKISNFDRSGISNDDGAQKWVTRDIDGDGRKDLIIYQEGQGGFYSVFGLPNTPHWKVHLNTGEGFSTTAIDWALPEGGFIYDGVNHSFNSLSGGFNYGDEGSQYWTTTDMNGDGRPDLLVHQEKQGGSFRVYDLPNGPHWKVYLNTGAGFSTTARKWTLPEGGLVLGPVGFEVNYSFHQLTSFREGGEGSQTWTTKDMNGDGSIDLVVLRENKIDIYNIHDVFGVPGNRYWKVFLNTGEGFSTTAIDWALPDGGYLYQGRDYSFILLNWNARGGDEGTQLWGTTDMDEDGRPDLIVYQEDQNGTYSVYDLASSPHWKVYLNSGSGFSTTATNWGLPSSGGYIAGGVNQSFLWLSNNDNISGEIGSQIWETEDINGDGSIDFVVYQENNNGAFGVSGLPFNPYWKVYLNSGSGSFTEAINWRLPAGGESEGGVNYGFDALEDHTMPVNSDIGSQYWKTTDMNGDGILDLVVFSENQGFMYGFGVYLIYGLPDDPHWKVYLGTTPISAIPDIGGHNPITIFPNPTTDIASIKIDEKIIGSNYQLFNSLGQIINKGTLESVETSLDLSKQANGIYYLSVGDELGYSAKIVKNK